MGLKCILKIPDKWSIRLFHDILIRALIIEHWIITYSMLLSKLMWENKIFSIDGLAFGCVRISLYYLFYNCAMLHFIPKDKYFSPETFW